MDIIIMNVAKCDPWFKLGKKNFNRKQFALPEKPLWGIHYPSPNSTEIFKQRRPRDRSRGAHVVLSPALNINSEVQSQAFPSNSVETRNARCPHATQLCITNHLISVVARWREWVPILYKNRAIYMRLKHGRMHAHRQHVLSHGIKRKHDSHLQGFSHLPWFPSKCHPHATWGCTQLQRFVTTYTTSTFVLRTCTRYISLPHFTAMFVTGSTIESQIKSCRLFSF